MISSNIALESNIQPIQRDTYPIGKLKTIDTNFLRHITERDALEKLRSLLGATNTETYIFKPYQFKVLDNSQNCGSCHRDPCWGPIKAGNNIELDCKCINFQCPNYSYHRLHPVSDEELQEEIAQFDPSATECVSEYGYVYFREHADKVYRALLNAKDTALAVAYQPEIRSDEEKEKVSISKQIEKINVVSFAKKEKKVSVLDSVEEKIETQETIHTEAPQMFAEQDDDRVETIHDLFKPCSQEQIISADPNQNIFVDAGPGTGKTYTLIQKLNYMVTQCNVNPEGILVLCFTNAALDEIKKRLCGLVQQGASRGLLNVDIRTFHSFSWWLINSANECFTDEGWKFVNTSMLNYDSSLEKATAIMKRFGKDVVANWEHFIVDEVQDLTNERAEFVLQIIQSCLDCTCGVTILGDACQAIYDYQAEYGPAKITSTEFYNTMIRKLKGNTKFLTLEENHRQTNQLIAMSSKLREAILSENYELMKSSISDLMREISVLSKTDIPFNNSRIDEIYSGGSICALFRNNAQTLKISSDLRKRGIQHRLNIPDVKNGFSPWIADIFNGFDKPRITKSELIEAAKKAKRENGIEIWDKLQKILGIEDEELRVRDILDAIAVSKIDESIFRISHDEHLTVSNIHRSKGREYDCVVIDKKFADSLIDGKSSIDEYKTFYVAITRPKQKLLSYELKTKVNLRRMQVYSPKGKRWGSVKNNKFVYLEFDSKIDLPVNAFVSAEQKDFDNICEGDALILRRKQYKNSCEYEIVHESTDLVLGKLTSPYTTDIYNKLSPYFLERTSSNMPSTIDDLYVSGIYSNIVTSHYLEEHPEIKEVCPNGVWKWIDIAGLGHLNYDVY